MKTRRLFIVTVLFFLCAVAVAQPKTRLLDKETFMDMESVSNPEISVGLLRLRKDRKSTRLNSSH